MDIELRTWEYIYAVVVVFLASYLLYKKLESKHKGSGILLIGFAVLLTANLAFLLLGGRNAVLLYINTVLYLMLALNLFAGSITKRILWACLASALTVIADMMSFALADFLYFDDLSKVSNSAYTQFYLFAAFILMAAILFVAVTRMSKRAEKFEYRLHMPQNFIVIAVTFTCEVMANRLNRNGITASLYAVILMVLYAVIFGYARSMRLKDESQMEAEQLAFEVAHYRKNELSVKSLRELRHDISTHMHVMKALAIQGKNEELVAYFNDVDSKYKKDTRLFLTNNALLNAMLSSKAELAAQYDIEINLTYNTKKDIPLSYQDFCGLFGNLLDNAIEANRKIPIDKKRYIDLTVGDKGEMVFIRVVNAADGHYLSRDGELQTTKNDAKHGLGLKRIQGIAENAGGFFDVNPQPDKFTAFVMLPPAKEENGSD